MRNRNGDRAIDADITTAAWGLRRQPCHDQEGPRRGARRRTLYGFLKANYQWETYARTNAGNELMAMATFLIKPIKLGGS